MYYNTFIKIRGNVSIKVLISAIGNMVIDSFLTILFHYAFSISFILSKYFS